MTYSTAGPDSDHGRSARAVESFRGPRLDQRTRVLRRLRSMIVLLTVAVIVGAIMAGIVAAIVAGIALGFHHAAS